MTPQFESAYSVTFVHEQGYANHPADRGGETWNGIARNMWPKWAGWKLVDQYKSKPNFPKNLEGHKELKRVERDFYYQNFFKPLNLDQVGSKVAIELFDTAVNMGVKTAAKMWQRALNLHNRNERDYPDLIVDGVIGFKTMRANNAIDPWRLYKTLNILQGHRYIEICERDPTQEVFYNGWLNRISI